MDDSIPGEAGAILDFWFGVPGSPEYGQPHEAWFKKDVAFDAQIRKRFEQHWAMARAGAFAHWDGDPRALLAYIVLCDQFPRNMFRGQPEAFATDPHALSAARRMVARGWDHTLAREARKFVYLPYEHSESLVDQGDSMAFFSAFRGDEAGDLQFDYARRHYDIIARFGRFPHRNEALDRVSTSEEIAFLNQPGSSF